MHNHDREPVDESGRRPDGGRGGWRSGPDRIGDERRPPRHRDHEGRGRPGGRGRGRAQRGDVRTAIMLVLADQPMHGYQIMQAMSERTSGAWRPSPGAVYPTIAQLRTRASSRPRRRTAAAWPP